MSTPSAVIASVATAVAVVVAVRYVSKKIAHVVSDALVPGIQSILEKTNSSNFQHHPVILEGEFTVVS